MRLGKIQRFDSQALEGVDLWSRPWKKKFIHANFWSKTLIQKKNRATLSQNPYIDTNIV